MNSYRSIIECMGSEKKLSWSPDSGMLFKEYSLENLLMEWLLWGWIERNEEKLFSLFSLMPLMGRLFASLVYLTTSWEDHYNPQNWAGAEVEPLWGSLCQESVPESVTMPERHLQGRAPWFIGVTPMDAFPFWFIVEILGYCSGRM